MATTTKTATVVVTEDWVRLATPTEAEVRQIGELPWPFCDADPAYVVAERLTLAVKRGDSWLAHLSASGGRRQTPTGVWWSDEYQAADHRLREAREALQSVKAALPPSPQEWARVRAAVRAVWGAP